MSPNQRVILMISAIIALVVLAIFASSEGQQWAERIVLIAIGALADKVLTPRPPVIPPTIIP